MLSLCKQGDHILAFVESYGPTRYIVQHLLAKFGVTHTLLSIEDLPARERQQIDADTDAAAETLAPLPDLLTSTGHNAPIT